MPTLTWQELSALESYLVAREAVLDAEIEQTTAAIAASKRRRCEQPERLQQERAKLNTKMR